MAYYVGIDIGATNLRAAVADGDGEFVATDRAATPRGPTGIAVTDAVLDVVRGACETAGIQPNRATAAGIGSIGPLDLAAGAIEDPANLPDGLGRIPLVGPLQELIDSPRVTLHNDTNAGCIGERYYSARNPDDMVYLTISSGIGAGVAVDGHVLSGWDGNAGEVGHMIVDPEGRRTCGCGQPGHWEAYCSGNNIPGYARLLHRENDLDTTLPLDDADFSAADVFAHAGADALADLVLERVAWWNTIGIVNVTQAYAPLVVYVGGAVALENPTLVLDPVREHLQERVFTNVPDLALTTLGDDAVLRGAVAAAITDGTGDRHPTD